MKFEKVPLDDMLGAQTKILREELKKTRGVLIIGFQYTILIIAFAAMIGILLAFHFAGGSKPLYLLAGYAFTPVIFGAVMCWLLERKM